MKNNNVIPVKPSTHIPIYDEYNNRNWCKASMQDLNNVTSEGSVEKA